MPKLLHLIVACSENRVIGRERKLPWHIPEDLAYFHQETAGQICVLGRICYETWPRARQDGRRPLVLTRRKIATESAIRAPVPKPDMSKEPSANESTPVFVNSLTAALDLAESLPGDIYICGGEKIYEETLRLSRPMRLHLTLVHAEIEGDTYFPEWRQLAWREIDRKERDDGNYRYTFLILDRV